MNYLIVGAIIAGVFLIAGFTVVNATSNDAPIEEQADSQIECSSCGNSCTASSNCGQATCGAVSGGSCGCN